MGHLDLETICMEFRNASLLLLCSLLHSEIVFSIILILLDHPTLICLIQLTFISSMFFLYILENNSSL